MKPEDLYDAVDRLNSRDGWIADKQTKGRMLENIVRAYIESVLPPGGSLRVSTGCVWDGDYRGELPQSDLILFENRPDGILYDSNDVVIVRDTVVRAIVSVKTNLSKLDVTTELPDHVGLLRKHPRMFLIFFGGSRRTRPRGNGPGVARCQPGCVGSSQDCVCPIRNASSWPVFPETAHGEPESVRGAQRSRPSGAVMTPAPDAVRCRYLGTFVILCLF